MLKLAHLALLSSPATSLEIPMHRTLRINEKSIDDKEIFVAERGQYVTTIYLGTPP